jgi:hypothetical protein
MSTAPEEVPLLVEAAHTRIANQVLPAHVRVSMVSAVLWIQRLYSYLYTFEYRWRVQCYGAMDPTTIFLPVHIRVTEGGCNRQLANPVEARNKAVARDCVRIRVRAVAAPISRSCCSAAMRVYCEYSMGIVQYCMSTVTAPVSESTIFACGHSW